MKILETRVSDSGLYVCVALNIAGNTTQSIELSVLGKLEIHKQIVAQDISKSSWVAAASLFSAGFWVYYVS